MHAAFVGETGPVESRDKWPDPLKKLVDDRPEIALDTIKVYQLCGGFDTEFVIRFDATSRVRFVLTGQRSTGRLEQMARPDSLAAKFIRLCVVFENLVVHGDGVQIAATPEQIGIRDGRRIRGRYKMTSDDLINGSEQQDSVVRATFPVDIHALSEADNKKSAYSNVGVKVKPYDIPLRALIARDVDGLMMAGRCISGDFIAHASYRVTGNAVAMGEAAGAVAALAAQTKQMPHDINWRDALPIITKSRRT